MFEAESSQLIEIVKRHALLDERQLQEVTEEHSRSGKSIAQVLQDFGIVDEPRLLQLVADELGTEYVNLESMEIGADVLQSIPASVARMYGAIPVRTEGNTVYVAVLDPLNPQVVDELAFVLGKDVHIVVAASDQIENALKKYFGEESQTMSDLLKNLGDDVAKELGEVLGEGASEKDIERMANETPIVRFVQLILMQAIQDRASDIHFEPFEDEFKIRYRVDGALYELAPPPKHLALPVTSRIKVMSNLNIAERRLPQDGRIALHIAGKPIDLRVSTLPTVFGESVVLRVLDRSVVSLDLANLGLPKPLYDLLCEVILKPNGILLVTGPTGSGKTTTLYSCLRRINTVDVKLLTAEDPVEYDIEGIIQCPMNVNFGMTFARAIRAFLRQDPDKIMVGEIRDLETAQIAIQASLTGHLVFSTLHTNDAPGAITRLIDMGVEPFLLSSTIEAVLAQRLVRTICKKCRTPYEPSEALLTQIGLTPHDIGDKTFYYGRGCAECNDTGYKGRMGIYECLAVSDPIRDLMNQRAPSVVIRQKAIELGMSTLRESGLRAIFDGLTTIEEVLKYT
jgi:type IV pilus assembly protein PilB